MEQIRHVRKVLSFLKLNDTLSAKVVGYQPFNSLITSCSQLYNHVDLSE